LPVGAYVLDACTLDEAERGWLAERFDRPGATPYDGGVEVAAPVAAGGRVLACWVPDAKDARAAQQFLQLVHPRIRLMRSTVVGGVFVAWLTAAALGRGAIDGYVVSLTLLWFGVLVVGVGLLLVVLNALQRRGRPAPEPCELSVAGGLLVVSTASGPVTRL